MFPYKGPAFSIGDRGTDRTLQALRDARTPLVHRPHPPQRARIRQRIAVHEHEIGGHALFSSAGECAATFAPFAWTARTVSFTASTVNGDSRTPPGASMYSFTRSVPSASCASAASFRLALSAVTHMSG